MRDTSDEVGLKWVLGKVNQVPPWALEVGHTLDNQPIMMALGYTKDEPPKLGHYTNGTSCAEYLFGSDHVRCGQMWKIATLEPSKEISNIAHSLLCMMYPCIFVNEQAPRAELD